jgi:methylated-DNA-[protein]-cysteine S-methyltransferase
MSSLTHASHQTPLGNVRIAMQGDVLCGLAFEEGWADIEGSLGRRFARTSWRGCSEAVRPVASALDAYFAGRLGALARLAIEPGGTPFQRAVWDAVRAIPAGATVSYGELARRIGRPGASRAVGAANGSNPIWLVIPCHRVIGADGDLVGYGGGIERKRRLLDLERRAVVRRAS